MPGWCATRASKSFCVIPQGKNPRPGGAGSPLNEWLVIVDLVKASAIDFQQFAHGLVLRVLAIGERQIELQSFRIALPPIDTIEQARCVDQFRDHLLLAGVQVGLSRTASEPA